jgi:hypothetical protein
MAQSEKKVSDYYRELHWYADYDYDYDYDEGSAHSSPILSGHRPCGHEWPWLGDRVHDVCRKHWCGSIHSPWVQQYPGVSVLPFRAFLGGSACEGC